MFRCYQNISKELQDKKIPESCYSSIKRNVLRESESVPPIMTYVFENDKKLKKEYKNFKKKYVCEKS